jgi:hypothetical protein
MNIINIAQAGIITDAPSLASVGMNVLNFLLLVFGIIAIIMLVISASIYFFAGSSEKIMEKAKQSTKYAIVGIALAMSGMIMIRFFGQLLK